MSTVPYSTSTTISTRLEIRSKLAALASHHGIALVSRRDHWDTCEQLLVGSRGDGAREIQAVIAALRFGIVADLVAWRADGAAGVERELTHRLADRAGIEPGLAYWAIESWALAYKIPLTGEEPAEREVTEAPVQSGRDVVIRARHLVLVGAFAGLAAAGTIVSGGLSTFRSAEASDSTTVTPPPKKRVPQQMARDASNTRRKTAQRPPRRDTTRVARTGRREQASLGEVVTRMPPARTSRTTVRPQPKRLSSAETEAIRQAFAMEPPKATPKVPSKTPAKAPVKAPPAPDVGSTSEPPAMVAERSGRSRPSAVQAGAPDAEEVCREWRPRLRRNYAPNIPQELEARGITSGRVLLRFRVDEAGQPDPGSARVLETSSSALISAAVSALEQLRYDAAPREDCGSVWVERTIRFTF